MGIDAALFSSDGQMFYYDREYNLKPPVLLNIFEVLWKEWNKLRRDGLSKRELKRYLRILILTFKRTKEEELFNRESQIVWASTALKWVESLPGKCKIVTRNDVQNEYFELYKKHEAKEKKQWLVKRGNI